MDSDPKTNGSSERKRLSGWKRIAFPCAAALLALVPLVLAEVSLAVLGLGGRTTDPTSGFGRTYPLFEKDPETGAFRTARARLSFFGEQQFDAVKKPGAFRAFCLGGSTVLGHPYQPPTAFSGWLEVELSGRDPSRRFEIVNCGGISYASFRLLPILDEALGHDPDLIVVATGHNEFLEDRTYSDLKHKSRARQWVEERLYSLRTVNALRTLLPERGNEPPADAPSLEVDARLDHESGYASYHRDEQWRQRIVADFEKNLRTMAAHCSEAGVPLVLVNLGSNVRDCPPFKPEHKSGLSAADLERWRRLFEEASKIEPSDPSGALSLYRQAEEIDGEHALLAYRIARSLDRLGRFDEARAAYVRAKDLDVCPLRMIEPLHRAVTEAARETRTPLIDARAMLESRSPHGLTGNNWFLDHVHPTIGGSQLIAQAIAERIEEDGLVKPTVSWTTPLRRRAYRKRMESLGDLYLARGRVRVEWLEHWARRDRLRKDAEPFDSRGLLEQAHAELDFGARSEALSDYANLLAERADLATPLLDRSLSLFRQGRTSAARDVARIVADHADSSTVRSEAQLALFVTAVELGQDARAMSVVTRNPGLRKTFDRSSRWLADSPAAWSRLQGDR